MTAGPISFQDMYPLLPYQFPLVEAQPIVRIPVAGPEPFNTLVVVRFQMGIGEFAWSDGKFHAITRGPVATGFTLAGDDDPRSHRPPSQHSSMAMLNHQQLKSGDLLAGDSPFVNAFDDVIDGRFEYVGDKWRWCLWWRTDWLADQAWAAATAYVSSWVLCWEPPREPSRPHTGWIGSQVYQPYDPSVSAVERATRSGPGSRPQRVRSRTTRTPCDPHDSPLG